MQNKRRTHKSELYYAKQIWNEEKFDNEADREAVDNILHILHSSSEEDLIEMVMSYMGKEDFKHWITFERDKIDENNKLQREYNKIIKLQGVK